MASRRSREKVLRGLRRRVFVRKMVVYVLAPAYVGLMFYSGVAKWQWPRSLMLLVPFFASLAGILYGHLCPSCSYIFLEDKSPRRGGAIFEIKGYCPKCDRRFDALSLYP